MLKVVVKHYLYNDVIYIYLILIYNNVIIIYVIIDVTIYIYLHDDMDSVA